MDKKKFLLNFAYISCLVAILVLAYKYLLPVMMPFIIGFIIAVIVNGMVKKAQTRTNRVLVLSVVYVAVAVLLILALASLIEFVSEIDFQLLYSEKLLPFVNEIYDSLQVFLNSLPKGYQNALRGVIDSVAEETQSILLSLSGAAVGFVARMVSSIPSLLLSTLIAIIASFYIAVDYDTVVSTLVRLVPKRIKTLVKEMMIFTKERLGKFIVNYLKLMFINFIECTAGFMLLGIKGAVPLAILTSIVDVLPILGTGTVLIPWGIISFFTNKIRGIGLLVLYVVITVIRNVIEPKFVGTSLNLHPLLTFVCMIVGLHFAGILGLFVLPMIASFIIYMNETRPGFLKSLLD